MTSDVIAVTLVGVHSLLGHYQVIRQLQSHLLLGMQQSEKIYTVAQPQYSPQVTTVIFSNTVPQKSTLPEHATTIPEVEEETQMGMCDCN